MQVSETQIRALHNITVASPCSAPWDGMQGDARVRHCGACSKKVFNLSAMTQAAAAARVAGQRGGELCVRFYRRADGTVMTSECGATLPVRVAARRLPLLAAAAVLVLSAAGCAEPTEPAAVPTKPAAAPGQDLGAGARAQWIAGGMG
jgi:hypothetical protein